MRWGALLLLLVFFSVRADARPDTHALLEKQSDAVRLTEEGDRPIYRVEICPSNKCDSFESPSSSMLDDYVYIYSVYVGKYVDFSAHLQNGRYKPMAFIQEANDKGYAKQIVDSYKSEFGCGSEEVEKCVLRGLRKAASVKHYAVTYDEGERVQTLVPDER